MNRPYLTTKSLHPENQETPIRFLRTVFVPDHLFYRRNHFSYPTFSSSFFWLPIGGTVEHPQLLSFQEINALPVKSLKGVLECGV
ncbi:hypothetical protein [Texcoconibacillus texcoconensis]|uniref:Uncharacterized protein n=1 Tax=Texcoconibacillus texcoconensis TaxID=1095777 RepID=A0A840QLZ9_9BACI|nr:hypothetical protein [Texcoconibacillus texcoconensis]MBB5172398.1 hypothetical protein [Texcoconibacillus texcoconensis]